MYLLNFCNNMKNKSSNHEKSANKDDYLELLINSDNPEKLKELLLNFPQLISDNALNNALKNSALGTLHTNMKPRREFLQIILQNTENRIQYNSIEKILHKLLFEKNDFETTNIIFKSLDKENKNFSNKIQLIFISGFGNKADMDDFLKNNTTINPIDLLTAIRFAKFNNNVESARELFLSAKEQLTNKDIGIMDFYEAKDLFYGIAKERNRYISQIRIPHVALTVDQLNNELIDSESDFDFGSYGGINKTVSKYSKEHFKYLENHRKYNPYLVPELDEWSRDITRNLRIRRSCKGGIERIIHSNDDNKIYFILNGFDPIRALNKLDRKTSFTSSEFRKIFREFKLFPELTDKKIVFITKNNEYIKPSQLFKYLENKHHYAPKILRKIKSYPTKDEVNSDTEKNNNDIKKEIFIEKIQNFLNKNSKENF